MNTNPAACTYEAQLAKRVSELLPGLDGGARLELLGAMDGDDLRSSLAFIASMYPQVFDFALVRDGAMAGRLEARLGEDQDDDGEPYCAAEIAQAPGSAVPAVICNASVGIFQGHGGGWHHFRGEGTVASPVELYDASHEPVIAWRLPVGATVPDGGTLADAARHLEQRDGLAALLAAVLADGHSARFALAAEDGACFADLVSTTGSQSSGIGRTPLGALQAAAAEYGIVGAAGHVPAVAWRTTGEETQ